MLDHHRNIGLEHRRKLDVAWNRRGFRKIVKPQMQCAPCRDSYAVSAHRIAIDKENVDHHMRIFGAGVQDAGGLMRGKRAAFKRVLRRNELFGGGSLLVTDRGRICGSHCHVLVKIIAVRRREKRNAAALVPGSELLRSIALVASRSVVAAGPQQIRK
jgi:hypothetical protein